MKPSPKPLGRVLVTPRSLTERGVDAVAELDPIARAGYEVVSSPAGRTPTEDQLLALLPGCVGWIAGVEAITARLIASADSLRVISRNGTGTDSIDLAAAAQAGIRIKRAAGANAQGVAELALTLSLCALRNVPWSASTIREGSWQRWPGRELADVLIGVVGLGAVGRRVAATFQSLGACVIGYDPFVTEGTVDRVSLPTLLHDADVVTLHSPPPPDGRPLITHELLANGRAGAVLVNTARAGLVDDVAVLEALDSGKLAAYAVDAFDTEPPAPSALLRHERVIATPHIGGYTEGSVRRATEQAVQNLLVALNDSATR